MEDVISEKHSQRNGSEIKRGIIKRTFREGVI